MSTTMNNLPFDIIIVSNNHRKCLISPYLDKLNIPYTLSLTPDYDLPADFTITPGYERYVANHVGAYRCFKGHQLALQQSKKDYTLVFEDDAVPIQEDWMENVQNYFRLFHFNEWLEVISLHGRMFNIREFIAASNHKNVLFPSKTPFVVASLAYIASPKAKQMIMNYKYDGLPVDLLIYQKMNYVLIHPSPFNHDTSEGSLIDLNK